MFVILKQIIAEAHWNSDKAVLLLQSAVH